MLRASSSSVSSGHMTEFAHLHAHYDPAPADVQRTLCAAAQTGDREARDRLVAANLAIVIKRARQYAPLCRNGLDGDDLVTEGVLGLLRAIEKFDPQHGVTFLTYADHWVRQ